MTLRDAVAGARRSVFRLEALQEYVADDERAALAAWREGRPVPIEGAKRDYCALVRGLTTRGVSVTRVHVVWEPLTDYLRFELGWSYPLNVEVGEDVRIAVGDGMEQPPDFWLVDDEDLWLMLYDGAGRLVKVRHAGNVAAARQRRDDALQASTPLQEYMTRAA